MLFSLYYFPPPIYLFFALCSSSVTVPYHVRNWNSSNRKIGRTTRNSTRFCIFFFFFSLFFGITTRRCIWFDHDARTFRKLFTLYVSACVRKYCEDFAKTTTARQTETWINKIHSAEIHALLSPFGDGARQTLLGWNQEAEEYLQRLWTLNPRRRWIVKNHGNKVKWNCSSLRSWPIVFIGHKEREKTKERGIGWNSLKDTRGRWKHIY